MGTLVPGPWPPGLGENAFQRFQAAQSAVIRYDSLRNLNTVFGHCQGVYTGGEQPKGPWARAVGPDGEDGASVLTQGPTV